MQVPVQSLLPDRPDFPCFPEPRCPPAASTLGRREWTVCQNHIELSDLHPALGQFVQMINRYVLEIPIMGGLEESLLYQTLWLYMQGAVNTSRAATGFRATSLINMAADEADVATLKAREARMQTAGLTHERIISRDELRERLRHVQPPPVWEGGVTSEAGGLAIPFKATNAFRLVAEHHDARGGLEGCKMTALRRVGPAWLAETSAGRIKAETVAICAGGAWADRVGGLMIGDNLPVIGPTVTATRRFPRLRLFRARVPDGPDRGQGHRRPDPDRACSFDLSPPFRVGRYDRKVP